MSDEETIFAELLSKGSATDRDAYLAQACAGDDALRRAVEALLHAHDRAGGILESPPAAFDATSASPTAQQKSPPPHSIGSTVGPYKLLEQIGAGGMGVVYMAEQLRPIRRKVALKIIKPGMDSGQVIARFEAERQALTMMDHPNIARVLDAGTTDAGRPYFVMELVKGIPITDYCDDARLAPRERLELFVQVCNAVQHAHQKGIIHRDLKPGNVLVTLHDDKPVPKVIDFGIAKAAGQVLTEKTLFTNYAQMLGTPLYMSPEQAQISGIDVDTRSDVYSLGVLLYELLTGTTPFDKQRLRDAAYDEMRRIIREEEPPNPSTRLSTMGDRLASVSAMRHTEPKKLGQIVRGELDWIAMKALEKDRTRRFETAIGLARDVERYLNNETVEACPPSATYRLRKFVRRNKAALLVTAALLVMLLSLVVGLAVSNRMIAAERNETAKALALAEAQRRRAETNFWKAAVSVRDIVTNVANGSVELPTATRQTFTAAAMRFYQGLIDDDSTDPARRFETGIGYRSIGLIHASAKKVEESHAAFRQAIGTLDRLSADVPDNQEYLAELATTRVWFSRMLDSAGKTEEGAEQLARAREGHKRALSLGSNSFYVLSWTARLMSREAVDHARAGRMDEFRKVFPRVIELCDRADKAPRDFVKYPKGVDYHRTSGHTFRLLAFDLQKLNLHEEAEQSLRRSIVIFDRAHAEEPETATHYRYAADTRRRVGESLMWRNHLAEAESMLRDAEQRWSTTPAEWAEQPRDTGSLSSSHFALAELLANTARQKEAADCMARGLAVHPDDERRWREAALLYLGTDDRPRYRHACEELLNRFTGAAQADANLAARIVRACAASPDAVNDFSRVRKLADHPIAGIDKSKAPRNLAFAKGLADYRAGDFSGALQWFGALEPKPGGGHADAAAFAAMAMSYERLGRRQEAQDALAAAGKVVSAKPQGRYLVDWSDWLHAEILVREAGALLRAPESKTR